MPYNPDGTLTIRGSDGSTKTIKPEEMVQYGIGWNDYTRAKNEYETATGITAKNEAASVKAGLIKPETVSESARQELLTGGYNYIPPKGPTELAQEKTEETKRIYKNQALDLATQLKDMDTRGITGISGALNIGKFIPGTATQNVLKTKEQLVNTLKVVARSAIVGQGQGQISDPEQAMLAAAATKLDGKLSNKDFQTEIQNIIDVLNGKYLDPDYKPKGSLAEKSLSKTPSIPEKKNPINLKAIGDKVADAMPIVGGIIGGVAGSAVGAPLMGIGAIPAGAAGTAFGTAMGVGARENLENLFGTQENTAGEQLKSAVVEPVVAGVLDLATAGLFKLGSKAITAIGSNILKIADDLPLRIIRPSKTQILKFQEKTGVKLKDFMVEKGLFKQGVQEVDDMITPIQNSFDDIAKRSGIKIPVQTVADAFDNKITQYSSVATKEAQQFAKALSEEKTVFLKKYLKRGRLGIEELTELRRQIDNIIPDNAWLKDPLSAGVQKTTRSMYQEIVQNATLGLKDAAGRDLKQIGKELSKLYAFKDIVKVQEGLGKGTLPVGLLRTIGLGGVGTAIGYGSSGDVQGAGKGLAIGLGLPYLLNNPKVISFMYKNMTKLGIATQGLPSNIRVKFLTDAFRRMLTNIGAMEIVKFGTEDPLSANKEAKPQYYPRLNLNK